MNVGDVYFVYYTIDGFPEKLPHHLLMCLSGRICVHHLLLKLAKFVGRNVDSSSSPDALGFVFNFLVVVVLFHEEVGLFSQGFDESSVAGGWLIGWLLGDLSLSSHL